MPPNRLAKNERKSAYNSPQYLSERDIVIIKVVYFQRGRLVLGKAQPLFNVIPRYIVHV